MSDVSHPDVCIWIEDEVKWTLQAKHWVPFRSFISFDLANSSGFCIENITLQKQWMFMEGKA